MGRTRTKRFQSWDLKVRIIIILRIVPVSRCLREGGARMLKRRGVEAKTCNIEVDNPGQSERKRYKT